MAREAERNREPRPPSVGADHHRGGHAQIAAVAAREHDTADARAVSPLVVHERSTDDRPFLEANARRDGRAREHPIEIAPQQRVPARASVVAAAHRDAVLPRHEHAVHRRRDRVDRLKEPEALQDRHRAGIDRVAAQLVAGESSPIEHQHARATPREHRRRDRTRRTRSTN